MDRDKELNEAATKELKNMNDRGTYLTGLMVLLGMVLILVFFPRSPLNAQDHYRL